VFAINPPKLVIQPPSVPFQNKIKVTGTNIYRIKQDTKKICDTHVQMDLLALYRQLGIIELLDEKSAARNSRSIALSDLSLKLGLAARSLSMEKRDIEESIAALRNSDTCLRATSSRLDWMYCPKRLVFLSFLVKQFIFLNKGKYY
jgi:hypothetical protein